MLYVSDDRKRVFKTEQECCEYEQIVERQKSEEKIRKENLASERKKMMEEICKKRKELIELTEKYQSKFDVEIGEYLPFGEFLKIMYGC